MTRKTFSLKAKDVAHNWVLVDASTVPLGRLSSFIAQRLTGKYQPTFTPHIDNGDYVVVINADDLVVTGNKETTKTYYRHSGYPGGIKSRRLEEARQKNSAQIIENAVKGMLPKNKLAPARMLRLKVYPGAEHAHAAQKPAKLEVK